MELLGTRDVGDFTLLGLAEATDCRRVRLLAYFGEPSQPCTRLQNACDNCLSPPVTWNATEAARKALSCIYRFHQNGGQRFGAGHLIDVLRGKVTDKVTQHGHATLSTFGIGADVSEGQWRAVLRQLIALGYLRTEGEYHTLELTSSAREVLRGEVQLLLRETSAATSTGRSKRRGVTVGKPLRNNRRNAPVDRNGHNRVAQGVHAARQRSGVGHPHHPVSHCGRSHQIGQRHGNRAAWRLPDR